MKFKVGDIVRIKADLVVGATYYNEGTNIGDKFSSRMRNNLGKEGKIIGIENGKYILDIDSIHGYYDGMLEYPVDDFANEQYTFNPEVEAIIAHTQKNFYMGLIDKALDERMHETNPEEFQKLVDIYKIYA